MDDIGNVAEGGVGHQPERVAEYHGHHHIKQKIVAYSELVQKALSRGLRGGRKLQIRTPLAHVSSGRPNLGFVTHLTAKLSNVLLHARLQTLDVLVGKSLGHPVSPRPMLLGVANGENAWGLVGEHDVLLGLERLTAIAVNILRECVSQWLVDKKFVCQP